MLGDQLLASVSDIINKAMPENAFAARVGVDEFVVLVPKGSTELAEQFIQKAYDKACNRYGYRLCFAP